MTALLIASTALLVASASSNGSGSLDCPVSNFGAGCLVVTLLMWIIGIALGVSGALCKYDSKWPDKLFLSAIVLLCVSIIPLTVALIHDCQ